MAKRFTATEIWDKLWFRSLPPAYKALWKFLCDRCDIAGVWDVDIAAASFYIGAEFGADDVLKVLGQHIQPFDSGRKWWLIDFVPFQYGKLSTDSRVHQAVISLLKKYTLWEGYAKGMDRVSIPYPDSADTLSIPYPQSADRVARQGQRQGQGHKKGGMGENNQEQPVDKPIPLTPIQEVVEQYLFTQGLKVPPEKRSPYFKRFGRAASDLLEMAGGDWKVACYAIANIGVEMKKRGLSWTLDTVAKHYVEWAARREAKHGDSDRDTGPEAGKLAEAIRGAIKPVSSKPGNP